MNKSWLGLVAAFVFPLAAEEVAGQTAKPIASLPGVGQVVISLALVVGLLLVLAWSWRKLQLKLPGSQHFKVVASLNIGPKERILVIDIQGKQRVLGVTSHSINFLFELENNLPEEKLASDFHTQLQTFLKK